MSSLAIYNVLDFSKTSLSAIDFKSLKSNGSYIDDKFFMLANNTNIVLADRTTATAPTTTNYETSILLDGYTKPVTTTNPVVETPTTPTPPTTEVTTQPVVTEPTPPPVTEVVTEPVQPPVVTEPEVVVTPPTEEVTVAVPPTDTTETTPPVVNTEEPTAPPAEENLEDKFIKHHRHHHKHNFGHHFGQIKHCSKETKPEEKVSDGQTEIAKESRGIWGDPHYTTKGANGEKVDFMHYGKSGETYNVFEGDGYQIEGLYDNMGKKDVTFVVDTTVKAGEDTIKYNVNGKTSINDKIIDNGQVTLKDGTKVEVSGKKMTILSREGDSKIDFTNSDGICIDPEGKFGGLTGILGKAITLGKNLTEEEANKFTLADLI